MDQTVVCQVLEKHCWFLQFVTVCIWQWQI